MARNDISDKVYGIIYKIENLINGKIYIGQTTQKGGFDARYGKKWWENTHNEHLRLSVQKYGVDNFKVTKILRKCYKESTLNEWEKKYIKQFKSNNYKYGYNKNSGGVSVRNNNNSKKSNENNLGVFNTSNIKSMIETIRTVGIVQYGKIMNLVEFYDIEYGIEPFKEILNDSKILNEYILMAFMSGYFTNYNEYGEVIVNNNKHFEFEIYISALNNYFEKCNGRYMYIEKLKEIGYIEECNTETNNTKKYKLIRR